MQFFKSIFGFFDNSLALIRKLHIIKSTGLADMTPINIITNTKLNLFFKNWWRWTVVPFFMWVFWHVSQLTDLHVLLIFDELHFLWQLLTHPKVFRNLPLNKLFHCKNSSYFAVTTNCYVLNCSKNWIFKHTHKRICVYSQK